MNDIEKYYNKFNEDKRLLSRHGQVEFFIANHYIDEVIAGRKNLKILDVGAGTGRYSIRLAELGHDVTAIEYVNKNVSQIKMKSAKVVAKQGDARKLKAKDNEFDIVLLFGPLYHLFSNEDKLKALEEAKRVVKPNGHILVMYLTNEYAIVTYALKEGHLKECIKNGMLDENFKTHAEEKDLYSYVTLADINYLNEQLDIDRVKVVGVDGPTDYIRPVINKMDDEDFETYKKFVLSLAERHDLIGASSHIMDILMKQ